MRVNTQHQVDRMRASLAPDRLAWRPAVGHLLRLSAQTWLAVAIAGQWVFVYYIAGFYAAPTMLGHFATWNRQDLITGYVPGDRTGNLYFASHVLMAGLITASGTLQIIPSLRRRAIRLHRWNGRFYVVTAFLMAFGGLWLIWVRGTYLTILGALSSTLLAALILTSAAMTLRHARAGRIERHRRWAVRLFLVVNGVWFQRIGYVAWMILARGPVGIGKHMDGPFDILWGYGEFLLPLLCFELYERATRHNGLLPKSAMTAVLLAASVVTAIGSVGAYVSMWRPVL